MALPHNRKAVLAILEELNPRILGQMVNVSDSIYGTKESLQVTAVSIIPGGDDYPGQETAISTWYVRMRSHPGDPIGYEYPLYDFMPYCELKVIFSRHFGQYKTEVNPYSNSLNADIRVMLLLAPAVRIMDNDLFTKFCIDWGCKQEEALRLHEINQRGNGRVAHQTDLFEEILSILELINPDVYPGGPEPELAFESEWLTDFNLALESVSSANHMFILHTDKRNQRYTYTDIVFMKVPVA